MEVYEKRRRAGFEYPPEDIRDANSSIKNLMAQSFLNLTALWQELELAVHDPGRPEFSPWVDSSESVIIACSCKWYKIMAVTEALEGRLNDSPQKDVY